MPIDEFCDIASINMEFMEGAMRDHVSRKEKRQSFYVSITYKKLTIYISRKLKSMYVFNCINYIFHLEYFMPFFWR